MPGQAAASGSAPCCAQSPAPPPCKLLPGVLQYSRGFITLHVLPADCDQRQGAGFPLVSSGGARHYRGTVLRLEREDFTALGLGQLESVRNGWRFENLRKVLQNAMRDRSNHQAIILH